MLVRETESGPELADAEREVTFRHLFTHTAGLSYGWNENDPVDRRYREASRKAQADGVTATLKIAMETLAQLPLAFHPGARWRYSLSIDMLGYLVELISGQPFDVFLEERLFKPLGMVDTAFYVPEDKKDRVAAVYGHAPDKEGLQRNDMPLPTQLPSYVAPGGGLFSTLDDYARFCRMLVNGGELDGVRILSPTTVAMFSRNQAPPEALPYGFAAGEDLYHAGYGYSLGTRVLMDVSKTGLASSAGEFGWDGAFNTYFWIDPQEKLYGLLMLQHGPNAYYPIAQQFKQLAYQALIG